MRGLSGEKVNKRWFEEFAGLGPVVALSQSANGTIVETHMAREYIPELNSATPTDG